jgi:fructokinase
MTLVAGLELGGTKCIAVIADADTIVAEASWPTDAPGTVLPAIAARLAAWRSDFAFATIGIGSFGPLALDLRDPRYGRILDTPKQGWSGTDLVGYFRARFDLPVGIDTDVAGAALAEGQWGAAQGADVHVYITVGTGVGGGVVVNGRALHGLLHPEIGHIRIRRQAGDSFAGACPFHGDCAEGLVSGPALAARAGRPAAGIGDGDPLWTNVAAELAELAATIFLTVSPRRILFGGGVIQRRPFLMPDIARRFEALLAGYVRPPAGAALADIVRPAALGPLSGPLGATCIGRSALRPQGE